MSTVGEIIPTDDNASMAMRTSIGTNLADRNVVYSVDLLPADVNLEYKPLQPANNTPVDTGLVVNGSFFEDFEGWAVGDFSSCLWQSTGGVDGFGCAQSIGDGTGTEQIWQYVPIVEGHKYHWEASLWSDTAESAIVSFSWYNSGYVFAGSIMSVNNGDIVDEWVSLNGDFAEEAPVGAVYVAIGLSIPLDSTVTSRWDGITLSDITTPAYQHIQAASISASL